MVPQAPGMGWPAAQVPVERPTCPYCRGDVHPAARKCQHCGEWLSVPPKRPQERPACSRGVYIVIGLFLGGLGIHNFIAGRYCPTIAQLLVTVLTGWLILPLLVVFVWVIVELFTVDRDGRGLRMG